MTLASIRYNSSQLHLKDWSLIKVTGNDREIFFQGQLTNDLNLISHNQAQITARLNRAGKIQSIFFIAKFLNYLLILCPKELHHKIKSDFEKYIIMDDVVLEDFGHEPWLIFNSFLLDENKEDRFADFNFYGLNARLAFEKHPQLEMMDENELEKMRILNGWPKWGVDIDENNFINDSYLNEIAISYKKGCFLGQETVAKIENNRGAAYYPILLKLETTQDLSSSIKSDFKILSENEERKAGTLLYQVGVFLQATLYRDFRVNERKLELLFADKKFKVTVHELPFYKAFSRKELALELYHDGVDQFQKENFTLAQDYMKRSLAFDPTLADAYESLGVMLGRMEKFEDAIGWMDKLLNVNPASVMAHTNKSLFLMRLGKIEEAEAEKGLATVKSFAYFGEEAKLKKQMESELKKKEEDILRREKMFLQVLEIDEEDAIALYGMADIFYHKKEYLKAIANLEKVISINSKYSTAYLLLGKCYEAIARIREAQRIYQEGILISSKQGDMMPANEMQSRLNKLVVGPSLN